MPERAIDRIELSGAGDNLRSPTAAAATRAAASLDRRAQPIRSRGRLHAAGGMGCQARPRSTGLHPACLAAHRAAGRPLQPNLRLMLSHGAGRRRRWSAPAADLVSEPGQLRGTAPATSCPARAAGQARPPAGPPPYRPASRRASSSWYAPGGNRLPHPEPRALHTHPISPIRSPPAATTSPNRDHRPSQPERRTQARVRNALEPAGITPCGRYPGRGLRPSTAGPLPSEAYQRRCVR